MELTDRTAQTFVGGQIKAQNQNVVFCGEIREIAVVGNGNEALLRVRLNWKALGQGPVRNPRRWVNEPRELDFEVPLVVFHITRIGKGRLALRNTGANELVFLYPASAPTLDRNDVAGLRQLP
jgi:hypothetical protein